MVAQEGGCVYATHLKQFMQPPNLFVLAVALALSCDYDDTPCRHMRHVD